MAIVDVFMAKNYAKQINIAYIAENEIWPLPCHLNECFAAFEFEEDQFHSWDGVGVIRSFLFEWQVRGWLKISPQIFSLFLVIQ